MEIIYVFIALAMGLGLGFIIRMLLFERHAVSGTKYREIQKELDISVADYRVAKSEQDRLHVEMENRENLIRQLQQQINEMTAESSKLKTLSESSSVQVLEMVAKEKSLTLKIENQQTELMQLEKDKSEVTAKHNSSMKRIEELQVAQQQLVSEMAEINSRYTSAKEQLTSFKEQNSHLQEKLDLQKQELEQIGQKFTKEFQLLAEQILEQKSQKFTELNQIGLKAILEPLGKNIDEFKKKVEESYINESKERFSLAEKVKELTDMNLKISQEAHNLTQALKGSVKQQGNWGEMLLESILQNSGLRKGFEYDVQEFLRDESGATIKDDEGKKLQPDIIVNLPDDRQIIIDSKVSLIAYDRYMSADDKHQQSIALAEHNKSIKAHIDGLSARNYQNHVKSLDFVMLFVPIEPAYMIAMQHDVTLWEYAYKKRILLISPTNLIAALKLVADLWQREQQNRNAMLIAERGGQLYDKFAGFVESLEDIGRSIDRSQKSYDSAMKQLKTGSGNLMGQVEKLKKLGVKSQKAIPSRLIEEPEESIDGVNQTLEEDEENK